MVLAQQPESLVERLKAVVEERRREEQAGRERYEERRQRGRRDALARAFAARFNLVVTDNDMALMRPAVGPEYVSVSLRDLPGVWFECLRSGDIVLVRDLPCHHTARSANLPSFADLAFAYDELMAHHAELASCVYCIPATWTVSA